MLIPDSYRGRVTSARPETSGLLLIKDRKLMLYLPAGRQVPKLIREMTVGTRHCELSEAELISDMSIRIYFEASITCPAKGGSRKPLVSGSLLWIVISLSISIFSN